MLGNQPYESKGGPYALGGGLAAAAIGTPLVAAFKGEPDNPQDNPPEHPIEMQLKNQKVAEAAKMAPVAGKYTEQGKDQMIKDTYNNADDITRSKYMIQSGMMGSRPLVGGF